MHPRIPKRVKEYFKLGGATSWWDTEGVKPLGNLTKYIIRRASRNGSVVLDVGTGKGRLAIPLSELAMRVVALDISSEMLSVAHARAKERNVDNVMFVVADAENLPFVNQGFDSVLCIETLVHLPNPSKAMVEIARVVRQGGIVIADAEIRDILYPLKHKDVRKLAKSALVNYLHFLIPKHFKNRIIWKGYSKREFKNLFYNSDLSMLEFRRFQEKYVGVSQKMHSDTRS